MIELKLLPSKKELEQAVASLSFPKFIILIVAICVMSISTVANLSLMAKENTQLIPDRGGEISEGIVGVPRFINPVLATSDIDKDLVALIYSGLLRYEDGKIVNDLAESVTASGDLRVYNIRMKEDAVFHDGMPVTAEDVAFTIEKVLEFGFESPQFINFRGVEVKVIAPYEIQFILPVAHEPFLSYLSVGILPTHKWQHLNGDDFVFSENNINPIGSGPFKIRKVERKSTGITSGYKLIGNSKYYNGIPFIDVLNIVSFDTFESAAESFLKGDINHLGGLSPSLTKNLIGMENLEVKTASLPRTFGIFFNESFQPKLANLEVRQAISELLSSSDIINKYFNGYAEPIRTPADNFIAANHTDPILSKRIETAKSILEDLGWELGEDGIYEFGPTKLTLTLYTASQGELPQIADYIKTTLRSGGIEIIVKEFSTSELSQNVIRARDFDMLLFGNVIRTSADLYSFWHSSQAEDPGLNISQYKNERLDELIESLLSAEPLQDQSPMYTAIQNLFLNNIPSVYLFSPQYIYATNGGVKGINFNRIQENSGRFNDIEDWYIKVDSIWKK